MQAPDFATRQVRARGIVRIGEEDHPRAIGHRSQHRIDIGAEIGIPDFDRCRTATACGNIVDREAVTAEQHFVARPGESLRGKVEQLVRSGAADDPRRIEAVFAPQRRAQCAGVRIGIFCGGVIARQRRQRCGAATQRVFVGGQLGQPAPVRAGGLARNIGVDARNPGLHRGFSRACIVLCHSGFVAWKNIGPSTSGRLVVRGRL